MTELHILHFNDVYRVGPQKLHRGTIDVTQFAEMLNGLRNGWRLREDGFRDGLVLFSGDLFAPSVESSVTRGSHMVPVINELAPDVSLTGNHDFDFGYPHLTKLLQGTKFPWLLSNIVDTDTSLVPSGLHEFFVIERAGARIGIIGLVEREWIATVSSWPANFKYRDMTEVALDLSKRLRGPDGPHKCDFIIALTHCRLPNDIGIARTLKALTPSFQDKTFAETHGVDIVLGGHDHFYFVTKGVDSWEGIEDHNGPLGAEGCEDVLVIKSGTDFRELSEISLTLVEAPGSTVRKKIISSVSGKRHATLPGSKSSERLKDILKNVLSSVSRSMKAPVCRTEVPLDLRSEVIRTTESAVGNWFSDIIRHAYDDALCMKGYGGSDAVFICAGTLRGDMVYGPGIITLGDILEILPFEDPVVVLKITGKVIWDSLEAALSTWPAQEGRFPVVSALRVQWDSRRQPGDRVLSVFLERPAANDHDSPERLYQHVTIDLEEVKRDDSRTYNIVTREYMARGHDGFTPLLNQTYLVDEEQGEMMSSIVRKYLLGAKYIKKMCQPQEVHPTHLHVDTDEIIVHAKAWATHLERHTGSQRAKELWSEALNGVKQMVHSPSTYRAPFSVSMREHMTDVDCFDGQRVRAGEPRVSPTPPSQNINEHDPELVVVSPEVDGRLKDIARIL